MNAPPIEIVVRFGTAMAATVATILLFLCALRLQRDKSPRSTPLPLLRFLTWIVGISAVWRWFLFWLGFQTDLGEFGWIVPWIQPLNASIIWLLYMGLALIGYFHLHVRRKVEGEVAAVAIGRLEGPDG